MYKTKNILKLKIRFLFVSLGLLISSNLILLGQNYTDSSFFQFKFKPTLKGEISYYKKLNKEIKRISIYSRNQKQGYSKNQILSSAKKITIHNYMIKDFIAGFSDKSLQELKTFFNTSNSLNMKFEEFYDVFADSSISDLEEFYKKRSILRIQDLKGTSVADSVTAFNADQRLMASLSSQYHLQNDNPNHVGISGSKLVVPKYFNSARRDLISTVDQSIYLRGRKYNTQSPFFPDYSNVYCDECCGPAAGQSILEWFNVEVKDNNGNVLTETNAIQKQLAREMETEDGSDYTNFYDLYETLEKSKYRGNKGFCRKPGDGNMSDIFYMLSQGTPVILLTAWDTYAHYITVYGYDESNDRFKIANSGDFTYEKLKERFFWEDADWHIEFAMNLVGNYAGSLFSYCPTGCDRTYAYTIPFPYISISYWPDAYFDEFCNSNTTDERDIKLNFYARMQHRKFPDIFYTTSITNAGSFVRLKPGNSNIITQPNHLETHEVHNIITGHLLELTCKVDRNFVDNQPEIECFWMLYGKNNTLIENVSALRSPMPGDPNNYYYRFSKIYTKDMKKLRFSMHGNFRKVDWELYACTRDLDNDNICDEIDSDWDNDGILNTIDNCPETSNPDQTDNDKNGIGYACDQVEQCGFENPNGLSILCFDLPKLEIKPDFRWWLDEILSSKYLNRIVLDPANLAVVRKGKNAYRRFTKFSEKLLIQRDIGISKETREKVLQSIIQHKYF